MQRTNGFSWMKWLWLATAVLILAACNAEENNEAAQGPDTFDYASGGQGFSVVLRDVGLQVRDVEVRPGDDLGTPEYAYVIVSMIVANQTEIDVLPAAMTLVDQHENQYVSWQTNVSFGQDLTALPLAVPPNQTVEGHQVFIVPYAALGTGLHLRWQSAAHQSRLEIYLDDLPIPTG